MTIRNERLREFADRIEELADKALEDAICDGQAMGGFVGVDLGAEVGPDATTLLHFRHLLKRHELTRGLLDEVNAHLTERGLLLRAGTLVDATIVGAPSSTKNRAPQRDPEMHQVKNGNQWHGMKAQIGADADSGLVHRITGTAAVSRRVAHPLRRARAGGQPQERRAGVHCATATGGLIPGRAANFPAEGSAHSHQYFTRSGITHLTPPRGSGASPVRLEITLRWNCAMEIHGPPPPPGQRMSWLPEYRASERSAVGLSKPGNLTPTITDSA